MRLSEFSSRSSDVSLVRLTKKFRSLDGGGEVVAVNDLSLDIGTGELVTILGPSGCGKTTTLRMVAGFEFPTSGSILIGGKDVAAVPPNRRGLSMVFQSYALFPHLTIYENVAYGLRVQKLPASEIEERTRAVLDLMQITSMQKRYPAQVSGGQQQRIALARAIVIEPSVLLFDEPLSNLDAKLREYMRDELRKLQKRLGITSLYVTHDQEEAMAISDRIVIMQDGVIRQVGSPRAIYEYPESVFVATFMGKANILPVTVLGTDGGETVVELAGKRLSVPNAGRAAPASGAAGLVVRPEAVLVSRRGRGGGEGGNAVAGAAGAAGCATGGVSAPGAAAGAVAGAAGAAAGEFPGAIERTTYFGNIARYEIPFLGTTILAERYNPQGTRLYGEGEAVDVSFEMDSVRILPES